MDGPLLVAALSALGQPHRLNAYRIITGAGAGGVTPGALADELGVAKNLLTSHLAILVRAGLVVREERGRTAVLTRNDAVASALVRELEALLGASRT